MWKEIESSLHKWAIKKYKGSSNIGIEERIFIVVAIPKNNPWENTLNTVNNCPLLKIEDDPISTTHEIYTINKNYGYKIIRFNLI